MRSQEFTAKTTQEAIDEGLAALGVTIADVRVDVIQEGAKGLFGLFGSRPARVRITVMEDEAEDDQGLSDLLGSFSLSSESQARKKAEKPAAPKTEKAEKPKSEKPAAPKAERTEKPAAPKTEKAEKTEKPRSEKPAAPKAEKPAKAEAPKAEKAEKAEKTEENAAAEKSAKPKKPRAPKQPREEKTEKKETEPREYAPMVPAQAFTPTEPPVMHDEATPAGRAQRFLMDVTARMNVKVDVYVDDGKEDNLYIHMIGDTLGILIGRRGETLDALQYLTSLQVNKGREGYIRVTLDTENYRAKREDSLRRLAQRMANRAQKTGRKVVLEPMNPYERRVLHTALQNHPGVTTHSEGEEPNRRVVIMLAGQSEKPERAEKGERGEKSEKSGSSRRSRGCRRGRRGPKAEGTNAAAENTAAVSENTGAEE